MSWDDDPTPRNWISATPAHLDRASLASPPIESVDDVDPEGDAETERLCLLDELAADHLGPTDRLLYLQVLKGGLPISQVAPGVGLHRQAASDRCVAIVRRLRILAAAPELPSLTDTLAALAAYGHTGDIRAAWLHADFRSCPAIGRVIGIAPKRVTYAIRRGLAVAEERADIAEAVQLIERCAYRAASGWAVTRAPRTRGRRAFERAMEAA